MQIMNVIWTFQKKLPLECFNLQNNLCIVQVHVNQLIMIWFMSRERLEILQNFRKSAFYNLEMVHFENGCKVYLKATAKIKRLLTYAWYATCTYSLKKIKSSLLPSIDRSLALYSALGTLSPLSLGTFCRGMVRPGGGLDRPRFLAIRDRTEDGESEAVRAKVNTFLTASRLIPGLELWNHA